MQRKSGRIMQRRNGKRMLRNMVATVLPVLPVPQLCADNSIPYVAGSVSIDMDSVTHAPLP